MNNIEFTERELIEIYRYTQDVLSLSAFTLNQTEEKYIAQIRNKIIEAIPNFKNKVKLAIQESIEEEKLS